MADIKWFGHAALKIELAGKILFLDSMLQSPNSPIKPSEITKADLVYVTHNHPDHLGDASDISKRMDAVFAAVYKLAEYAAQSGVKIVVRLNVSASYSIGDVQFDCYVSGAFSCNSTPSGRNNRM